MARFKLPTTETWERDAEPRPVQRSDVSRRLMHRLAARLVAHDPEFVEEARRRLADHAAVRPGRQVDDEWRRLMELPDTEIRRILTLRNERMDWLRSQSPFALAAAARGYTIDDRTRVRLNRTVRRLHASQRPDPFLEEEVETRGDPEQERSVPNAPGPRPAG